MWTDEVFINDERNIKNSGRSQWGIENLWISLVIKYEFPYYPRSNRIFNRVKDWWMSEISH